MPVQAEELTAAIASLMDSLMRIDQMLQDKPNAYLTQAKQEKLWKEGDLDRPDLIADDPISSGFVYSSCPYGDHNLTSPKLVLGTTELELLPPKILIDTAKMIETEIAKFKTTVSLIEPHKLQFNEENQWDYQEACLQAAELLRLAEHMVATSKGKTFVDLPDMTSVKSWHKFDKMGRLKVIDLRPICARLFWIRNRRHGNLPVYPLQKRYEPLECSLQVLNRDLEEPDKQYLPANYNYLAPCEWTYFLINVAYLTYRRTTWSVNYNRYLRDGLFEMSERELDIPEVSAFTTPATEEEIERTGTRECPICYFTFGPEHSEDRCIEPAVKTNCNHLIGAVCCQSLVNNGICPLCRQRLWDIGHMMPQPMNAFYQDMCKAIKEAADLDKQVDEILLAGMPTEFDADFYTLLHKLNALAFRYARGSDAILNYFIEARDRMLEAVTGVALQEGGY
ncbi:hypothetical protein P280DRAFT_475584 [Massarina eburnea CBS 473.64]|uniref:RING-type domain-containing protein n=1 Tax=Massarina eburnea CBS 473.64 TaxID=1395130 RepID=A0A6A6SG28_9PLEO|nr:hypothetical protein P280DRAFT_475584 [Massarina eburnea CBS 473.64]